MNKLLGQHFLTDKTIAQKMVNSARLKKNETVLEIGPGKGVLTERLLQKRGVKVVAVEKDRKLVRFLKEKFSHKKNLEIIEADILKILSGTALGLKKYKVVANIPYYLTGNLIRRLLETRPQPQNIILMIQKEVAQRITARPPQSTLLAMAVQFYARPRILFSVPKRKFRPPPKVDSAVVALEPKTKAPTEHEQKNFFRVLRAGFSQPRKTLLNNFHAAFRTDKITIEKQLKKCGVEKKQRAQELELRDWLCLTKSLKFETLTEKPLKKLKMKK